MNVFHKKLIGLFVLCINCIFAHAQNVYTVNSANKKLYAVINAKENDGTNCSGTGRISIFKTGGSQQIQTLQSEDLIFTLDSVRQLSADVWEIPEAYSPLYFEDFNFDGTTDIAIRNGNNSGYGGPSYDVYVYNITKKQFVLSKELTALAYENLGMFSVDAKKKLISTYTKSGCCWHSASQYKVVPHKGLRKVYEFIEDATGGEENMKLITKKWVQNKWQTTTKTVKIADYYKEYFFKKI
jgi:hypothetical protein